MSNESDYAFQVMNLATAIPILTLGTTGNFFTLLVLRRPNYTAKSFSVFLRALAVADTLALWVDPTTVEMFNSTFWDQVPEGECTFYTWFVNLVGIASSWTLVLVTLERLVIVYKPHKAHVWFTWRRAIVAVVAMWVLWGIVGTYILAHESTGDIICLMDDSNFHKRALTIFLVLYSLLPAIIILTANAFIISRLRKASKNRRRMSTMGNSNSTNQQNKNPSSNNNKFTAMLLTNSFVFILLTLPEALIFVVDASNDFQFLYEESYLDVLIPISDIMRRLNHAINFLLYCLSGVMFRRELKAMVLGWCGKTPLRRAHSTTFSPMSMGSDSAFANNSVRGSPARRGSPAQGVKLQSTML